MKKGGGVDILLKFLVMVINPQRMRRGLLSLADLGIMTLKTSINAKQIMFYSS